MKNSKHQNILKGLWILLISYTITGCSGYFDPCSEEEKKVMEGAINGNLEVVKAYLENGGDPMLDCWTPAKYRTIVATSSDLYKMIETSHSEELLEYYLNYNIPTRIKNKMFYQFLLGMTVFEKRDPKYSNRKNLCRILINHGGIVGNNELDCLFDSQKEIKCLVQDLNYKLNTKDENGNTILMNYALCSNSDNDPEQIEIIKYVIELGGDIHIRNNANQNAYDLATNPDTKAFLKEKMGE